MKYRYVNERLNTIITERTPKEETTISFVMSLLHLSKESAYRRLRNEIPYTVREVAVLTSKLIISLDELFDAKEEKAPLLLNLIESKSAADSYAERLRTVVQLSGIAVDASTTKLYAVSNMLTQAHIFQFPLLSKLRYFRWLHQRDTLAADLTLSSGVFPPQVRAAQDAYLEITKHVKEYTVIFDHDIIKTELSLIQFYRRINFITDADLLELKKELLEMLDQFELISRTGNANNDINVQLYLSDLPIESNLILMENKQEFAVLFLNSGGYPIVSTSTKVFDAEKEWFDSLLKFSVLMTRSNEILQTNFFAAQRNLVESAFAKMLN